jgi:hypothetical protein
MEGECAAPLDEVAPVIGLAFVAKLKDAGLDPVRYGSFGDYVATAGPAWVVYAAATGSAGGVYTVALQVRVRAKDARTAVKAGGQARDVVLECRYSVLIYTDPETDAETEYSV